MSYIFIFPKVKMVAKYAKLDREDRLKASLQQVLIAHNFWSLYNIIIAYK